MWAGGLCRNVEMAHTVPLLDYNVMLSTLAVICADFSVHAGSEEFYTGVIELFMKLCNV